MANTATAGVAPQPAQPAAAPLVAMDPEFIARNQIVERYFAGSLPVKGAADFERYCLQNPKKVDELKINERVHAGLRLLEASGQPLPWEVKPKRWWETLPFIAGVAALALALAITALLLSSKLGAAQRRVVALNERIVQRPLEPIKSTRTVVIIPDRSSHSPSPQLNVESGSGELIDLKLDVSWSRYTQFGVQVERVDQGQVLQLSRLLRNSDGQLRIAFNSSALGPGTYRFAIEGIPMSGPGEEQAWFAIKVSPG